MLIFLIKQVKLLLLQQHRQYEHMQERRQQIQTQLDKKNEKKRQELKLQQQQQRQLKQQLKQQQHQQKYKTLKNEQMQRQKQLVTQQQQHIQTQRLQQNQTPQNYQQRKQQEQQERQRKMRQQQHQMYREQEQEKQEIELKLEKLEKNLKNEQNIIKQLEKHQQQYISQQLQEKKQVIDQQQQRKYDYALDNKIPIYIYKENMPPNQACKSFEIVNSEFACKPLSYINKSGNKIYESISNSQNKNANYLLTNNTKQPVLNNNIQIKESLLPPKVTEICTQINNIPAARQYSYEMKPTTSTNKVVIVKTPKVAPVVQNAKSNKLIMPKIVDKVVFSNSKLTMNKVNAACLKSICRVGTVDISKPTTTKRINLQYKIQKKIQGKTTDVHFAGKTVATGTTQYMVKMVDNIYDPISNRVIGQHSFISYKSKPNEQHGISNAEKTIYKGVSIRSNSPSGIGNTSIPQKFNNNSRNDEFQRIRPTPADKSLSIPQPQHINTTSKEYVHENISDTINTSPEEIPVSTPDSPQYEFDLNKFINSSLDTVGDTDSSSSPPSFIDMKYFNNCNEVISSQATLDLHNFMESKDVYSADSIALSSSTSENNKTQNPSDKRSLLESEQNFKLKIENYESIKATMPSADPELYIQISKNVDNNEHSKDTLSSLMSVMENGDGEVGNVDPFPDMSTTKTLSTINASELMDICKGNDMHHDIKPHTLRYTDSNIMKLSSFEIDRRGDTRNDIAIVNRKLDTSDRTEIFPEELAIVNKDTTEQNINIFSKSTSSISKDTGNKISRKDIQIKSTGENSKSHSFTKIKVSQGTDSNVSVNVKSIQSINESNALPNPYISINKDSSMFYDPCIYLNTYSSYSNDVNIKKDVDNSQPMVINKPNRIDVSKSPQKYIIKPSILRHTKTKTNKSLDKPNKDVQDLLKESILNKQDKIEAQIYSDVQDVLQESILNKQDKLETQIDTTPKKKENLTWNEEIEDNITESYNNDESELNMLQEDDTEYLYENLPRYELEELSTDLFKMETDTNMIKDTNWKKYLKEENKDPIWGVRQYGSIC